MDDINEQTNAQNGNNSDESNSQNNIEPDRIKNLQAEMSRKTQNLDDKLNQINESLRQMSLLGNNAQPPRNEPQNRPDPVLDPEGYERYIEQKMESKMNDKMGAQQRQQAELATLVNMFPELSDSNSELNQAAIKAYNSLSSNEKSSPSAYRLAVQSAALELGVLPKNKRQDNKNGPKINESDDFGNNTNTNNYSKNTGNNKNKAKVDQATIEFAKLLGRDTNDPKYMERLQKAASRTKWKTDQNKNDY